MPQGWGFYFRKGGTFAPRAGHPARRRHGGPTGTHRSAKGLQGGHPPGALVIRGPHTGSAGALWGTVAARVWVLLDTAKVWVLGCLQPRPDTGHGARMP